MKETARLPAQHPAVRETAPPLQTYTGRLVTNIATVEVFGAGSNWLNIVSALTATQFFVVLTSISMRSFKFPGY